MGQRVCMNTSCSTTSTVEWKKGWPLRAGGFADLCFRCGSAYENSLFCDTFHKEQPGWRECYMCHKLLHCGCIASKYMIELLDLGGVGCSNCTITSLNNRIENPEFLGRLTMMLANRQPTCGETRILDNTIDGGRLSELCQIAAANEPDLYPQSQPCDSQTLLDGDKREELTSHRGFSQLLKPDAGELHELLSQPSLSMSLAATPAGPSFSTGPKSQTDPSTQSLTALQSCPVLPKPATSTLAPPESIKSTASQLRTARPPVEGRGKNHLLPRYWPRITDQELQQISGNLNSKIVPLFEKILSASDSGRIGRLVLPKACAEAYFPPINQSEGIPLKIQDVKGKEWTFQFRFWPNNNSRMYVLEGVTPCIHSMQLQAGDTVTFSRIDPGGRLVMGFRKTANAGEQINGASNEDTSSSGVTENPSSINGSSGHLHTAKAKKGVPEHLLWSPDGEISTQKGKDNGGRAGDGSSKIKEKKRTRNIGAKHKRLLLHNEESMELRITWGEAQDMLRPPPRVKPGIVTVEEHEFEEYDEPPVFGKKTIFTSRSSGEEEQWAQCDNCSKWRRVPLDALLPSRWACSDNVWDIGRCSCSAEEENTKEIESFLRVGKEPKKRRVVGESQRGATEDEPSGLDALASAAVLGDTPEAAATTRHPRHRPGCSCIVCIQPPSGKGKHKPSCNCNVCMTVKRRFRTLMLKKKKKKKQLERKGGLEENKDKNHTKDNAQKEGSTGNIDLNSNPCNREDAEVAPEDKDESRRRGEECMEESGCAQRVMVDEGEAAEEGREEPKDIAGL